MFVLTAEDGSETIVRSCAIESLDTICGPFNLGNVLYNGCISSCETDACNSGQRSAPEVVYVVTAALLYLFSI